MREIQRQTSTFAYRLAEKSFDYTLVDRLEGEFNDWAKKNNATNPSDLSWAPRGPIGHWPNIELFLKDRYPAAHRNLAMGDELSRPLMDRGETPKYRNEKDQHPPRANPAEESLNVPYETGPEALARYGYDPKEITAAMLLLHDDSHIGRTLLKRDQNRLNDIARKRHKMQEAFEMAHHAIRLAENTIRKIAADDQYSLENIWKDFQDWWKPFGDRSYRAKDSIKRWGTVEEYLMDRHGLDPYDEATFSHPATLTMSKLHSLAQSRPWVDGQEGTEDYLLKDSDLLTGAALGLLKIRRNQKTKKLEPDNPEDEDY